MRVSVKKRAHWHIHVILQRKGMIAYKKLLLVNPEAATETIFKNVCSFSPRNTFSGFFQEALCVHRTDTNFPGGYVCLSNR